MAGIEETRFRAGPPFLLAVSRRVFRQVKTPLKKSHWTWIQWKSGGVRLVERCKTTERKKSGVRVCRKTLNRGFPGKTTKAWNREAKSEGVLPKRRKFRIKQFSEPEAPNPPPRGKTGETDKLQCLKWGKNRLGPGEEQGEKRLGPSFSHRGKTRESHKKGNPI